MRHLKKAVVGLAILTACSSGGSGWTESQRADFIAGCKSKGQSEASCTCIQKKIEAAHPDLKDPAELNQDELIKFSKECVQ